VFWAACTVRPAPSKIVVEHCTPTVAVDETHRSAIHTPTVRLPLLWICGTTLFVTCFQK
jgi:hypothetical protein